MSTEQHDNIMILFKYVLSFKITYFLKLKVYTILIMTLIHHLGMFLLGIRDSLSFSWIRKVMLYTDPQTNRIHPSSNKMLKSLQLSFVQVIVFLIAIPSIFNYMGYSFISGILNKLFLILTFGYLFFYNDDLITSTRNVLLWKIKTNKSKIPIYQLDKKYKIQIFTSLSGQLKGFIFLILYYMPIYIIETQILINIPYIGLVCLIASQSFFNGAFYFLKIWPYDKYNIGYIQKNIWYMSGYGLFVSIICNAILSGSLAQGAYFLISMIMFINCVIYSPPQIEFKSFKQIYDALSIQSHRNSLTNGYNTHRQKTMKDSQYRKQITRNIKIVYPSLWITQKINKKLSHLVKNQLQSQTKRSEQLEDEKERNDIREDSDEKQSSSSLSIAISKLPNDRKLSQVSQVQQIQQNKQ